MKLDKKIKLLKALFEKEEERVKAMRNEGIFRVIRTSISKIIVLLGLVLAGTKIVYEILLIFI
jgi:hypothetical protein